MEVKIRKTSKAPIIVLIIGLILIGSILLTSSFILPQLTGRNRVESIIQSKTIVDEYLDNYYPTLQVDEIMEFSNNFYIRVVETSTKIGAVELLIDRNIGRVFFEPGPNMMWNTKYGPMYQDSNASAVLTITPSEAINLAQVWLDKNILGAVVEDPMSNYGYYTLDFIQNGTIIGMLSVNGDNGEIWYHSWHGTFISEITYG